MSNNSFGLGSITPTRAPSPTGKEEAKNADAEVAALFSKSDYDGLFTHAFDGVDRASTVTPPPTKVQSCQHTPQKGSKEQTSEKIVQMQEQAGSWVRRPSI